MIGRVFDQLRPLLRHPGRLLASIAILGVAVGLCEAAVLILVVNGAVAIADGTSTAPIELPVVGFEASLGVVLTVAGALAVVVAVVNVLTAWLSAQVSTEVLENARHRVISAFLSASWEKQATEREGSLQESVTSLAINASVLTMALANALAAFLGLSALLLAAFFVDALVAAIVVAVGVGLFAVLRPLSAWTRHRSQAYVSANSRFAEDVARTAAMAMELRVFGVNGEMGAELDRSGHGVAGRLRRSRFGATMGTTLYRNAAVLALVAAVAALDAAGGARLVAVGAVALLVVRSLGYATTLQSSLQQTGAQAPNLFLLTERTGALEAERDRSGSTSVDSFERIELRDVSYAYDERTPALRHVDLVIRSGDVLGVVGPSGSGKSTLLQVLLRLRRPVGGSVLVDGTDYVEFDDVSWSRLVAFVPQEPRLVEASVADNIAFLRPWVTRTEIEKAADDAHVGDEIRALADGFDTRLGPNGSGLSGGQKQRVAFARALVGRPRLLVLDEPTSALDGESERRIQETIAELKDRVTLVIVAHRLSTLDVCDRVVSVRSGRIETAELPSA